MKLVYVHIGPKPLPGYFWDSVEQARKYGNTDITLITDGVSYHGTEKGIEVLAASMYNGPMVKWYEEVAKKYNLTGFWDVTFKRLFYLYHYAEQYGRPLWHMEYDNLLYTNLDDIKLDYYTPNPYITFVGDWHHSFGIMFVPEAYKLKSVLTRMLLSIGKYDSSKYPLSEMTLSAQVVSDFYSFQTRPIQDTGGEWIVMDGYFDPAAYGQYLGGIDGVGKPGHAEDHHYIGEMILKKEIDVAMVNGKPYVLLGPTLGAKGDLRGVEEYEMIPIYNLHIHSKNLRRFM